MPLDEVPAPEPEPDPRDATQMAADAATMAAILALADDVAARRPDGRVELAALLGRRIQAGYLGTPPWQRRGGDHQGRGDPAAMLDVGHDEVPDARR